MEELQQFEENLLFPVDKDRIVILFWCRTTWGGSTDSDASSVICRRMDGGAVVGAAGNRKPGCWVMRVIQIALLLENPGFVKGCCAGISCSLSIQLWSELWTRDLFRPDLSSPFWLRGVLFRAVEPGGVGSIWTGWFGRVWAVGWFWWCWGWFW